MLLVLILYHVLWQQSKLVLNVMLNPWAHGHFIINGKVKDGFQHHFYIKLPRFVVVVNCGSDLNPAN